MGETKCDCEKADGEWQQQEYGQEGKDDTVVKEMREI